jgi:hypothetical protein
MIVMGTHGRSRIAHLLMGSVAESVIRTAPCPVLTVKSRDAARVRAGNNEAAYAWSDGIRSSRLAWKPNFSIR